MKELSGLPFELVMKFTSDKYDVMNEDIFNTIGGVYAVFIDSLLKYVGVYSHTFQHRWVNKMKNKNCVRIERHFKYHELAEMADDQMVEVYALTEDKINDIFNSPFVNPVGIEYRLIKDYMPPLNKMQGHGYASK